MAVMNVRIIRNCILIVILVVASLLVKNLVLDGIPVVHLAKGSALSGAISQSLPLPNSKIRVEGKNYTIRDARYFDNKIWAVATIDEDGKNKATLVLKNIDGFYRVLIGPGTAFPQDYSFSLPNDVNIYLSNQGLFYEPTPN